MKKVLTVLEYGGAATQDILRGLIFKPYFDECNVGIDFIGRHPSALRKLRSSESRLAQEFTTSIVYKATMTAYEKIGVRFNDKRILHKAKHYDVIHLIKGSSLNLVKNLRTNTSARIVYDIGDALWMPFYKGKYAEIDRILSSVDAVTCDNQYGLAYAKNFNNNTFIWPTISQVELFDLARGNSKPSLTTGIITIGWVGSTDTAYNLYNIWEVLERIFDKYNNIHLRLLGVAKNYRVIPQFENVRFSVLPGYTTDVMMREVLKMDIGLFPMFDIEHSAVRGILKALVYMSGEAAVVGSPRGEMVDLIQNGENGYLADTNQKWIEYLSILVENAKLRQKIARAGLETVRSQFTVRQSFECLRKALNI